MVSFAVAQLVPALASNPAGLTYHVVADQPAGAINKPVSAAMKSALRPIRRNNEHDFIPNPERLKRILKATNWWESHNRSSAQPTRTIAMRSDFRESFSAPVFCSSVGWRNGDFYPQLDVEVFGDASDNHSQIARGRVSVAV